MKLVKKLFLLISFMIISIGYVNEHNIKIKTIIDKKDFKIHEDEITDYVRGSYKEFSTAEFKKVYFIYLNDLSYLKVSKEFYNNVNIGYNIINE